MKISSKLLFIVFIYSCNNGGNNSVRINSEPDSLNDTLHIIKEFSGLLINGKKEKTFISCEDPSKIHLLENNDQTDTLLKSILPDAYEGQSVFLKMMAEIKPASDHKYSDILEVRQYIKAEQKNQTNTCIPYDFWGKGNEPFWQLQISQNENLIDFYKPMENKTIHFLYTPPVIKNDIITYLANDENSKNSISIILKKEKCSDGMSEIEYNYSAEIILNGNKFKGCAVKFGEQEK
jgi:uncharacterized membrane protein